MCSKLLNSFVLNFKTNTLYYILSLSDVVGDVVYQTILMDGKSGVLCFQMSSSSHKADICRSVAWHCQIPKNTSIRQLSSVIPEPDVLESGKWDNPSSFGMYAYYAWCVCAFVTMTLIAYNRFVCAGGQTVTRFALCNEVFLSTRAPNI